MRQYFLDHLSQFELPLPDASFTTDKSLDQLTFDQQYEHWAIMNSMVSRTAWILYE